MKKNIGSTDKVLRIVIGIILLSLYFFGPQTAWGLLGIIPILTALIGVCPAYLPLRITTLKEEKKSE